MINKAKSRQNLVMMLLFAGLSVGVLLVFVLTSWRAGDGEIFMPLDDVYIHFQYAKQLALGQPYVYNPGQPPTSGATSFLYPYVLAVGYWLGFQGLNLGLWAMFVGGVALFASMVAVYRICEVLTAPYWLRLLTAITFGLTGSIAWHYMSGMETGLLIAFMLWTLLAVLQRQLGLFVIAATLMALTRPEGSIMAVLASGIMFLRCWRHARRASLIVLLVPVLALGLQPLVNYALTGTVVASGNQAKSVFGMVPYDLNTILNRIIENFVRLWRELITGYSPVQGWYLPILTVPVGLVGLILLFFKQEWRLVALLILGWLLAVSAAVSTLDTAFWHFKRYQAPLMALFFPLSAYAVTWGLAKFGHYKWLRYQVYAFDALVVPVFVGLLFVQFVTYHAANVRYVVEQPLAMARWLQANTPEDAVVAVHDVGMMRYMGGRTTVDIVGLTTPGAAVYWRNGPGSVAEYLMRIMPDYIASYGAEHGYGLRMLEETSLYGEPLAEFTVDLQPHLNVALAASSQGIYQPDWESQPFLQTEDSSDVQQVVDVANLESEAKSNYQWQAQFETGFPTEVHEIDGIVDAVRRINGEEAFDLHIEAQDTPLVLVTRVHAAQTATFDVYIDDHYIDTNWIPEMPGHWIDIPTLLPPEYLNENARIRIIPHGDYFPAIHTVALYFEEWPTLLENMTEWQATYQDGVFGLEFAHYEVDSSSENLQVDLSWLTTDSPTGDYRRFVHVYDDLDQPPVAQRDSYPADSLPPGNWLPGRLPDSVAVDIRDVPAGTYQIAVGFYDPQTHERLIPVSDTYEVMPDGRLLIGTLEITNDG